MEDIEFEQLNKSIISYANSRNLERYYLPHVWRRVNFELNFCINVINIKLPKFIRKFNNISDKLMQKKRKYRTKKEIKKLTGHRKIRKVLDIMVKQDILHQKGKKYIVCNCKR